MLRTQVGSPAIAAVWVAVPLLLLLALATTIQTVASTTIPGKFITSKRDPNRPLGRSETLQTLDGDPTEVRLHLERCQTSSNAEACIFAMDNDLNQLPTSSECSISLADMRPWFEARLEDPSYVTRVVICGIEQINNRGLDALMEFEILAGEHVCVDYRGYTSFLNKTFACDTFADNIRVQSHMDHAILALCEVEVYGKVVSLHRNTSTKDSRTYGSKLTIKDSISTSVSGQNHVFNAHDGNTNQYPTAGSCFISEKELSPYFEALLEGPALVRRLVIYNAADASQLELDRFEILVNGQMCFKFDFQASFSFRAFNCNRFGNRVRISHRGQGDPKAEKHKRLILCEVEIYGFMAIFAPPPRYKYIGCYREQSLKPDLQDLAAVNHMTVEKCERICRRRRKPFFGLQQGKQCWCSDRYGMYGRVADDACWMRCGGHRGADDCGSQTTNSVYEIEEFSANRLPDQEENPVSENPVPENPVPENPVPENPVPENPVPENPVPENPVPEKPVSEKR